MQFCPTSRHFISVDTNILYSLQHNFDYGLFAVAVFWRVPRQVVEIFGSLRRAGLEAKILVLECTKAVRVSFAANHSFKAQNEILRGVKNWGSVKMICRTLWFIVYLNVQFLLFHID
jgi:hypothetical protein